MIYLWAATLSVWILLGCYLLLLSRRQENLAKEVDLVFNLINEYDKDNQLVDSQVTHSEETLDDVKVKLS